MIFPVRAILMKGTRSTGSKMEGKSMRNKHLLFLLAAGLFLSLTGCEKEPDNGTEKSNDVNFTIAMGGVPETKTVYTGDMVGTWERIDWVEGDPLLIWSDNAIEKSGGTRHYANYVVSKPIETHKFGDSDPYRNQSWAIVRDDADLGLIYDDEHKNDMFKFWSIYPAVDYVPSDDLDKVNFTIPNEQNKIKPEDSDEYVDNMAYAFMLAAVEGLDDGSNTSGVYFYPTSGSTPGVAFNSDIKFRFYPAYTAFHFDLKAAGDGEIGLTKVVLSSSSPLAGDVVASVKEGVRYNGTGDNTNVVGASTYTIESDAPKEITFTFPENTSITQTDGVSFTVFALPQDIDGLSLVFTYSNDVTVTAHLKYNGNFFTFAACKKHVIPLALPASISRDVVLDFKVMPWTDVNGTITYGSDAVANAVALDYASGAFRMTGGNRRYENWFANDDDPIVAYFSVFAPDGGDWKIKVTGDLDKFSVTATQLPLAGSTESPTVTSETVDGVLELSGPIGSRVEIEIDRVGTVTESDQIQLNFYAVLEGREISINSEVTRMNALTISGKVGQ